MVLSHQDALRKRGGFDGSFLDGFTASAKRRSDVHEQKHGALSVDETTFISGDNVYGEAEAGVSLPRLAQ
ncbi:hypothetical protein PTKIN_Ptkin16aG0080300 [Pterospermum kingtungense]